MRNWKYSFNARTILLLLVIGLTGGYLYFQWSIPLSQVSPMSEKTVDPGGAQTSDTEVATAKFVPVPIKAYKEITERPLFVEGRLPPVEPEQKTSVVRRPSKPLHLKLEGVAMMPDNKIAIIRDLDTNELLHISQGMKKNDWKVESVNSESATITRKVERLVLKLEIDKTSANKRKLPKRKLPFRPPTR
jgi:hypothetical protein